MKVALQITMEGIVRALKRRVHDLADEMEMRQNGPAPRKVRRWHQRPARRAPRPAGRTGEGDAEGA
jgi:hypothetical protein